MTAIAQRLSTTGGVFPPRQLFLPVGWSTSTTSNSGGIHNLCKGTFIYYVRVFGAFLNHLPPYVSALCKYISTGKLPFSEPSKYPPLFPYLHSIKMVRKVLFLVRVNTTLEMPVFSLEGYCISNNSNLKEENFVLQICIEF